ncbi:MAG: polymer-forming cytoskeletal protein [Pseudomonadota bacterium]
MPPEELPLTGFLGPGAAFEGDLTFEGRLRLDGSFRGRIYSEGILEVGASGRLEGEADVARARIAGTVEGRLRVREVLTVEETAVLRGEVEVAHIRVARGASLEAHVKRMAEPYRTRGKRAP